MEKHKILVVDDEEIIRQLLVRAFGENGYHVEDAKDAEAALKRIKEDSFNLLIMDLKMPKVDGMDALKEIKDVNSYIEVIIITGYPTIELAVEAVKIGAFDFICKPFDLEQMKTTVGKCLEKQKADIDRLRETQNQLVHAAKMEAVGRMASGVAHEVKNPLGIILQGINYFEGALPPEEKYNHGMLGMMKDGVKRADRIVRALLDFSRAEELKIEQQEINTIIGSSIDLVRHRLKLNDIELVRELSDSLPKTLMDRGKIEQVLVNLFNNAVDAMPRGGKLYIRSYLSKLKAAENKVANRENNIFRLGEEVIIVEVEDTGAGIDEDIINKIFDPFFTTKSRTEGTGLGLSVAKSIIEMHKSLINVESKKGKGTKFTIFFKIPGKRG